MSPLESWLEVVRSWGKLVCCCDICRHKHARQCRKCKCCFPALRDFAKEPRR